MFGKDKNQKSREKVLYEGQPNIIVYNTSVLWALIVLGFLFTLYSQGVAAIGNMQVYAISSVKQPLTTYFAIAILVLIIVTFLFIALKLLSWTSVNYTITESRVIVEKGIIFNKQNSMPFNTIQDVSRSQSIIGRILSVGTIELYSAYDGKNLKIEDISSPKKVEDLIFENLRGTHLRTPIYTDDGYSEDFSPAEPGHYRRMEDLDDLTLVDAKEQKKMQREIRRQARRNKYRREHPKYGSQDGYDTKYGNSYNQQYAPDYDSGYYDENPGYPRENNGPDRNYNSRYGKSYRSSGAIRESYRQNPDKYFADNYEEFHQNNIDSPDDYANRYSEDSGYSAPRQGYQSRQGQSSRSYRPSQSYNDGYERSGDRYQDGYDRQGYGSQDAYGRSGDSYRPNENYDRAVQNESYSTANQNPKQEKPQSKGAVERIKGFNLFGSSNESEKDISDREFDDAIDQAMQNMEGSIKFQPNAKNDNMSYESYSPDGFENDFDYSSPHQHNDYGRKAVYYEDNRQYDEKTQRGYDSRDSNYNRRDDYRQSNSRSSKQYNNSKRYNNRNNNYRGSNDYNSHKGNYRESGDYNSRSGNYRDSNDYNPKRGAYGNSNSSNRSYRNSNSRDGAYGNSNSRNESYRNSNHYEDRYASSDYNQSSSQESGESKDSKNPDDLFAKHSKKFRKH